MNRVLIVMLGLAVMVLAAGCGQPSTQVAPATDTAVAAAPELAQDEEQTLVKLEVAGPEYQPVTKDNYQQELASLEAEVGADLQQ